LGGTLGHASAPTLGGTPRTRPLHTWGWGRGGRGALASALHTICEVSTRRAGVATYNFVRC
jgi:hypothetical protein